MTIIIKKQSLRVFAHKAVQERTVSATCIFSNTHIAICSFSVRAKDWKLLAPGNRYTGVDIPRMRFATGKPGKTVVFLQEGCHYAVLPFTYYQMHWSAIINAGHRSGRLFVSIRGHFIPNINSSLRFTVVMVEKESVSHRSGIIWSDYKSILTSFRIKGKVLV